MNFNFLNLENINLQPRFPKFWNRKRLTKETVNILFVDDEKFPIVDSLKTAGWHVERIKDISDIQQKEILRANIIFVDQRGVGKILAQSEEGIGLAKALKNHYQKSKRIIIYSGYSVPLKSDFRVADNQLTKDSDTYEFISMIESEMNKIKK